MITLEENKKTLNEMFEEKNKYLKRKKKDIKDKEIIETSFFIDKDYILEQIFNEGKNEFCVYNRKTKEIRYAPYYEKEETIIKPIIAVEINEEVVRLPSKAEKYESIEELDKEIYEFINEWLDVNEIYKKMCVWNIRYSWVYDKFHTLNYLRALGDTGTGKSRFLDTLGIISYKPMMVSGALTPAPIFRIINKWKGTLLIDEGDQKSSEESDAFIKILNCGYEKGRSVMRCDQNDADKLNFYNVYCPKIITTRKRFSDKATEARCITQIMTQTRRKDIKDILTNKFFNDSLKIRNKLLYYRLINYDLIDPEAGLKVDLNKYEPRLRQVNRGFVSLFSNDNKTLAYFYEQLDNYQNSLIEERSETFEGCLINSIATLICEGHINISPQEIADFYNNNYVGRYDVNSRTLGKVLKTMGINFKRKKVLGVTKNVLLTDDNSKINLIDVFSRYILDKDIFVKLQLKGYDVTSVTSVMVHPSNKIEDKKIVILDPRNQRNSRNIVTLNNLKKIFEKLKKEDFITLDIIKANFSNEKEENIIFCIEQLKKEGIIYEPKINKYKIIV